MSAVKRNVYQRRIQRPSLEIETYLNAYPGINASCTLKCPMRCGVKWLAFIVPEEGIDIDINDLMRYCYSGTGRLQAAQKVYY